MFHRMDTATGNEHRPMVAIEDMPEPAAGVMRMIDDGFFPAPEHYTAGMICSMAWVAPTSTQDCLEEVFHSSVFPKLLNASDFGFRDFVFTNTA